MQCLVLCLISVTSCGLSWVHRMSSLHLQVDGVLCLADILTDDSHSEATRAEAAAVVAQVTSPHLPFTQHLSSFLESMEEIVTALLSESPWGRGAEGGALPKSSSGRDSKIRLAPHAFRKDNHWHH